MGYTNLISGKVSTPDSLMLPMFGVHETSWEDRVCIEGVRSGIEKLPEPLIDLFQWELPDILEKDPDFLDNQPNSVEEGLYKGLKVVAAYSICAAAPQLEGDKGGGVTCLVEESMAWTSYHDKAVIVGRIYREPDNGEIHMADDQEITSWTLQAIGHFFNYVFGISTTQAFCDAYSVDHSNFREVGVGRPLEESWIQDDSPSKRRAIYSWLFANMLHASNSDLYNRYPR